MKRIATFALLALPAAAAAQQPSFGYTYVQGSILSSELNDVGPFDADGDGIELAGSFAVTPRVHVVGSYRDEGFDFDIDRSRLELGAGYNYRLQEGFDLVGQLTYIDTDIDGAGPGVGADGFGIEGAVRGRFTPRTEFDAGIRYEDVRGSNSALFFDGRYFLQPNLAVGGGVTADDGDLTLRADIRFEL